MRAALTSRNRTDAVLFAQELRAVGTQSGWQASAKKVKCRRKMQIGDLRY